MGFLSPHTIKLYKIIVQTIWKPTYWDNTLIREDRNKSNVNKFLGSIMKKIEEVKNFVVNKVESIFQLSKN